MTFGVRPPGLLSRIDAAIAPGTALCFCLFVAWLAPHYAQWYGDSIPPLTREYIARYPTFVAITAGGVAMQVVGRLLGSSGAARLLWKMLDTLLAFASVLIILVGMIALALPLFLLELPV
ncbi:MAG TPA: hypothetical protein VK660_08350 [Xanthomonadaceae bacterium]|jgi:hypothetical protein|nr:hypothetical protein [Xanthomonadaceae bacterium]